MDCVASKRRNHLSQLPFLFIYFSSARCFCIAWHGRFNVLSSASTVLPSDPPSDLLSFWWSLIGCSSQNTPSLDQAFVCRCSIHVFVIPFGVEGIAPNCEISGIFSFFIYRGCEKKQSWHFVHVFLRQSGSGQRMTIRCGTCTVLQKSGVAHVLSCNDPPTAEYVKMARAFIYSAPYFHVKDRKPCWA